MILIREVQILGTIFFALAVLHTFFVGRFRALAHRFPAKTPLHIIFHLLGEVEIVFGFWAILFSVLVGFKISFQTVVEYIESIHFTEPIFVFCIMIVSASKPILLVARNAVVVCGMFVARVTRLPVVLSDLAVLLILGPLLGSLITESGAITVSALLLSSMISKNNQKMNYQLLAILFVNISVGGALTPFAAPPILMVAKKWGWGFAEVFSLFGIHAIMICFVNVVGFLWIYRSRIRENLTPLKSDENKQDSIPIPLVLLHLSFLVSIVLAAHHPAICIAILLLFVGLTVSTPSYQVPLKYRESMLVAFFLAGLIYFGPFQGWWLSQVLAVVKEHALLLLATGLTAITDNAALTYLGSQVEGLSDSSKYFLVAGAIAGGGLTIIANAPNPAGFSILQKHFPNGLAAGPLFRAALLPTLVAVLIFSI